MNHLNLKAGDQVGFTDYMMGSRKTLFTAEVVSPLEGTPLTLLSSTGFWGPGKDAAFAIDQWFTWPTEDVFILEGEDLDYLNSFNETTEE